MKSVLENEILKLLMKISEQLEDIADTQAFLRREILALHRELEDVQTTPMEKIAINTVRMNTVLN